MLHWFSFTIQLIICGQALSHVVKLTIMDIIEDWINNNKKPEDMILLTDCKGLSIDVCFVCIYMYIYIC